jgi:hypothetical protein
MKRVLQSRFEAYKPHKVIAGLVMSSQAPGLISTGLTAIQKAPCSEHDFLASGNDIPTGVRIVQIAAELDETFVSVGDVLVDSRSRIRSGELTESHSHKDARVISQAQVNIRHQPFEKNTWILWTGTPVIVAEVLKLRPALKPEG